MRQAAKVAAAERARKYAVMVKVMPRLASQVAIIGPVPPNTAIAIAHMSPKALPRRAVG